MVVSWYVFECWFVCLFVGLFVCLLVVAAVCSARGLNLFLYVLWCVDIIILFMRFVIVWSGLEVGRSEKRPR